MMGIISFGAHAISLSIYFQGGYFLIWLIILFDYFILVYNVLIIPPTHTLWNYFPSISASPYHYLSTYTVHHFYFSCDLFSLNQVICRTVAWSYPLELVWSPCIHNWRQWLSLYLNITVRTIQKWKVRPPESLPSCMLDCWLRILVQTQYIRRSFEFLIVMGMLCTEWLYIAPLAPTFFLPPFHSVPWALEGML